MPRRPGPRHVRTVRRGRGQRHRRPPPEHPARGGPDRIGRGRGSLAHLSGCLAWV